MRTLRVVVNDIARAMRRQGKRCAPCCVNAHNANAMLIQYAEMLKAATRRQPKRAGKVTR